MQVKHIRAVNERHHEALALVEAWAPSLWVRDSNCRTWTPAKPADHPPRITDAIMEGLIDNGLVEVHLCNPRGGPNAIRPAGGTTSGGASPWPKLGRLTPPHSQV